MIIIIICIYIYMSYLMLRFCCLVSQSILGWPSPWNFLEYVPQKCSNQFLQLMRNIFNLWKNIIYVISMIFLYLLAIKYGNGTSPVYNWFFNYNKWGFRSEQCLMIPEETNALSPGLLHSPVGIMARKWSLYFLAWLLQFIPFHSNSYPGLRANQPSFLIRLDLPNPKHHPLLFFTHSLKILASKFRDVHLPCMKLWKTASTKTNLRSGSWQRTIWAGARSSWASSSNIPRLFPQFPGFQLQPTSFRWPWPTLLNPPLNPPFFELNMDEL